MERAERVLRDLCLEVATGDVGGGRFNALLIESGIYLDDLEWEAANRLLEKSEQALSLTADFMTRQ